MECLSTINSLKINKKKKINTVVIVVEGEDYEFSLFYQIFHKVLHYTYVTKKRGKKRFKEYNEFVMKDNENSRVIVINTKNSNIGSIDNDYNYRNELYKHLYTKYGLDIKNVPIYYIWDRDYDSNTSKTTKKLLSELGNAYENEIYENGLLLLSYPCCEAYVISNFKDNVNYVNDHLKNYVQTNGFNISSINQKSLLKAVCDMHKKFKNIGINDYSLDDFSKTSLKIYEIEENIYEAKKMYRLLSLISIIFLDLGIITFKNK